MALKIKKNVRLARKAWAEKTLRERDGALKAMDAYRTIVHGMAERTFELHQALIEDEATEISHVIEVLEEILSPFDDRDACAAEAELGQ